jgi:hypothetical protein
MWSYFLQPRKFFFWTPENTFSNRWTSSESSEALFNMLEVFVSGTAKIYFNMKICFLNSGKSNFAPYINNVLKYEQYLIYKIWKKGKEHEKQNRNSVPEWARPSIEPLQSAQHPAPAMGDEQKLRYASLRNFVDCKSRGSWWLHGPTTCGGEPKWRRPENQREMVVLCVRCL